jgi:hypothetical protein
MPLRVGTAAAIPAVARDGPLPRAEPIVNVSSFPQHRREHFRDAARRARARPPLPSALVRRKKCQRASSCGTGMGWRSVPLILAF